MLQQTFNPALPLKATEDYWNNVGRIVTCRETEQVLSGLSYYPQWATEPDGRHTSNQGRAG